MPNQPTVFVIDDDSDIRDVLTHALTSAGLHALPCGSAEEFLEHNLDQYASPRCLLLDVRLPGLSGIGLQQKLARAGVDIPIVFLTGVGDVGTAVHAMQAGAVDFIEKPVHRQLLLERVERALDIDAQSVGQRQRRNEFKTRLQSLSEREREVFAFMIAGKTCKEIGGALDVSIPTVTRHRNRVLQKLGARSVVELVKLHTQPVN